jgi:hypothetical protein
VQKNKAKKKEKKELEVPPPPPKKRHFYKIITAAEFSTINSAKKPNRQQLEPSELELHQAPPQ